MPKVLAVPRSPLKYPPFFQDLEMGFRVRGAWGIGGGGGGVGYSELKGPPDLRVLKRVAVNIPSSRNGGC